ncbi:MAG: Glutaredoxin-like protein, YruB-family [Parcubacteria group bacterium GW2011_GWA2_47_7]|nr:MAG: Glutaredoxin-like protein, YruB-family [Parcubacteria group bacterium GW2011_GWA2_47_7]
MDMQAKEKKVIVYSTPTCPYCVYTKTYFTKIGVTFNDIDVSKDQAAAEEMIEKSGQMGVPVIDIGGSIVVGFQPDVFEKLLNA